MSQSSLPLKDQLKALEQLQEIDLKMDRLKGNRDALPALLKNLDEALARVMGTVQARQKALEEIEKSERQTQAAMELNKDRLTRSNQRLEQVANSHEYQAATRELEQLRKAMLSLEDQSKKTKTDAETLRQELTTLQADAEKLRAEREQQAGVVAGQARQFETDLGGLSAEREGFTSRVERRILAHYDRVRLARGGLGIVPTVGGRCKGCNMMIPPQQYILVQRGQELQSCPSCHRILFLPAEGGMSAQSS